MLDQLARGPALVRQVIYEVPPELRKRRPAPGVWSAHEHAVHLPAIHPLMMRRLDHMLSEPAPHIKSYEPSRDDPDDALLKLDLDAEMDRFDRERAALIERLRTAHARPMGDHRRARRVFALRRVHHVPPPRRCTTCITRTRSKSGCCGRSGRNFAGWPIVMKRLRLRFSLKMLLAAITIMAVVSSLLVAPTLRAKRFVELVRSRQIDDAEAMLPTASGNYSPQRATLRRANYAELKPLTLDQLLLGKRVVIVFSDLYQAGDRDIIGRDLTIPGGGDTAEFFVWRTTISMGRHMMRW